MYECEICTFTSWYQFQVEEHEEKSHPSCDTCQRMFYDHSAIRQHYLNSSRHNYCEICNRDFPSFAARRQHYLNSSRHNFCEICNRDFPSFAARRQHYLTSSHHDYCGICEREFSSPAALRGHQQTHLSRDIECPRCDKSFTSASAMAKHVEMGKCFGLTHGQIVDKVRDWERRSGNPNLLTVPRLGYSSNDGTPGLIQATSAAYNGSAYECYFCQREFRLLAHLNQHLRSGIHLTEEFRCRKCGYKATWLSGLIEHIESERCGFMTRSQVKNLATPVAQMRLGN